MQRSLAPRQVNHTLLESCAGTSARQLGHPLTSVSSSTRAVDSTPSHVLGAHRTCRYETGTIGHLPGLVVVANGGLVLQPETSRKERRAEHRVPGRRRWPCGPHFCAGVHVPRRTQLGLRVLSVRL